MATKKKSTASTTTSKHYIVFDDDRDVVCEGTWPEILEELEEIMDRSEEHTSELQSH